MSRSVLEMLMMLFRFGFELARGYGTFDPVCSSVLDQFLHVTKSEVKHNVSQSYIIRKAWQQSQTQTTHLSTSS